MEEARPIFERFLKVYPTAGRYWKYYVDVLERDQDHRGAEQVLRRAVMGVRSLELWKTYLAYVIAHKDRGDVQAAYARAVDVIGLDVSAIGVWTDYLNWVKANQASAVDQAAAAEHVRAVFQRAVAMPVKGIEALWKMYEEWEGPGGTKTLAEQVHRHAGAKALAKERVRIREVASIPLNVNLLSRPLGHSPKDDMQLAHWKRVIQFEKNFGQRGAEPSLQVERVVLAYEQALLCFSHSADLWFEYSSWYLADDNLHPERAREILKRGVAALPRNLMLSFALADFEESRKNVAEAKAIYDTLLLVAPGPLTFIQHMRFLQRVDGCDPARRAFLKYRRSPQCTWQVYVAAALNEHVINKDTKAARSIFELGLKSGHREPAFLHAYLDFLHSLNDINNARVLYERALGLVTGEASRELWTGFMAFEHRLGELGACARLEKRLAGAFPEYENVSPFAVMMGRYRYLDLWPCTGPEYHIYTRGGEPAPQPAYTRRAALQQKEGAAEDEAGALLGITTAPGKVMNIISRYLRPDLSRFIKIEDGGDPSGPRAAAPGGGASNNNNSSSGGGGASAAAGSGGSAGQGIIPPLIQDLLLMLPHPRAFPPATIDVVENFMRSVMAMDGLEDMVRKRKRDDGHSSHGHHADDEPRKRR